jgi:putative flavoprotein involved in K+ transport
MRQAIDGYVEQAGIEAPPADEQNSDDYDGDDGFRQPQIAQLNLAAEGISTVIWSAGYAFDFSWVRPAALDGWGYPVQRQGVTDRPGLYFLGLNYLHLPTSGLLYGVGDDARHVAGHMVGHLGARVS